MPDLVAPQESFAHAERFSLKQDTAYDESWLEKLIKEKPQILGLGNLTNVVNQVTQHGAGRLDLQADDPKTKQRYVIELMLGELDGDHLVRTIDYWLRKSKADFESDREVVAVLAAEKVALARFFGVLQFLAENLSSVMPFIVLEVTAFRFGSTSTVLFNKIIDNSLSRIVADDDDTQVTVDRGYWVERASDANMTLIDALFESMKSLNTSLKPNYQPQYIGVSIANRSKNFCYIYPRKKFVLIEVTGTKDATTWCEALRLKEVTAEANAGTLSMKLKAEDLARAGEDLKQLLTEAYVNRIKGGNHETS